MKKTIILACTLLLSTTLFAQDDDLTKSHKSSKAKLIDMPEKKNCVKINLMSLPFKNIGIQYERALAPKIAVACQIRFMPKGAMPFSNSLDGAFGDSIDISAVKLGSFCVTPEFRFYPKHVLKGFYIAPYLRYRSASLEAPVTYTDDQNSKQSILLKGKTSTFGGGIMFGSHFNIGKSFSLDWFILGAHVTSTKMSLSGSAGGANLSASEQDDIEKQLNEAVVDNKLLRDPKINVNSQGADVSGKFTFVGIRGLGLNFGYRF